MKSEVAGVRLAMPPSLPQWLKELLGSLKKATQRDRTGRYREMWVLPAGKLPNQTQRKEIESLHQTLRNFDEMTPMQHQTFASVTLAAVSRMVLALGGRKLGDLAGEAKGEAYTIALEDVPYWAAVAAERRWYRGEYGKSYDYSFPPSPAVFRGLARDEQFGIRFQCTCLLRLLEAVAEDV